MATRINPSQEPLRALVYGVPGSTKTRTIATAAWDVRTKPMLMLDAGSNPSSIRDYEEQPDIIRMHELEDFNDPFDWIMGGQQPKHKFAQQFDLTPPYRSLSIDQLTDVQHLYFMRVLGAENLPVAQVVRKREWEHYNKVLYSLQRFVKNYYSLADTGMHVFMVAQEREGDPISGRLIGPLLEGQIAVYAPSFANLVIRMRHFTTLEARVRKAIEKDGALVAVTSVAYFTPDSNHLAKDQVSNGKLGDYMINPILPEMLDLIYS